MEKITAIVLFLTVTGALLVTASVSGTTSNGTIDQSDQINNFTTLAMKSDGNATTPKNVSEATPKTNQTDKANTTTHASAPEATPTTNQTRKDNGTMPTNVPPSTNTTHKTNKTGEETANTTSVVDTSTTNQTKKDEKTPGAKTPTPPTRPTKRTTTKSIQTTPKKPKTTVHNPEHNKHPENSGKITYIIIFVIVILCLVGAIGYCCYQNKTRTFSLDQSSKNEEANIPLSAVEPEVFEPGASKDMETFAAAETTVATESAPPADAAEKKEEEKAPAEATKQEQESSADSQATVPLVEKPGELTVVDLNDGEQAISNKTSVETLEETPTENNSNNSNNRAQSNDGYMPRGNFTEISLDDLL